MAAAGLAGGFTPAVSSVAAAALERFQDRERMALTAVRATPGLGTAEIRSGAVGAPLLDRHQAISRRVPWNCGDGEQQLILNQVERTNQLLLHDQRIQVIRQIPGGLIAQREPQPQGRIHLDLELAETALAPDVQPSAHPALDDRAPFAVQAEDQPEASLLASGLATLDNERSSQPRQADQIDLAGKGKTGLSGAHRVDKVWQIYRHKRATLTDRERIRQFRMRDWQQAPARAPGEG